MKNLGKKTVGNIRETPIDLLYEGQTVYIAGREYEVRSHLGDWFLDSHYPTSDHFNDSCFMDLGVNQDTWLEAHDIPESRPGGTFPWLTQENLTKAVHYLQKEWAEKERQKQKK